jgi:hypothetical protein
MKLKGCTGNALRNGTDSMTSNPLPQLNARVQSLAASGSRNCHECKHCGEPAGPYIRCEHPALVASCEPDAHDMREFAPTFAQQCDDFENDKVSDGGPVTPGFK